MEMAEVPKIVYDRLLAALPARDASSRVHPGADLLTAFAEQALPGTERDGVLEHLALCGDCREVVALTLPNADLVRASVVTDTNAVPLTVSRAGAPAPHKPRFVWPSLRWAAFATGIAVIAAVLLLRPDKPPASTQQIAASSVPSLAPPLPRAASTDKPTTASKTVATKTDTAQTKSESVLSKRPAAGEPAQSPQAESGMWLADNKPYFAKARKHPATPSTTGQAAVYGAKPRQSVNESVVVGGVSEAATVAPSTGGILMARNDASVIDDMAIEAPAIEKAKPAPPETDENELKETQESAGTASAAFQRKKVFSAVNMAPVAGRAFFPNVAWTIKAGVLQRSLDGGQSWQSAFHADHPMLCYATHDVEVWTGGEAGTLFHSADGGGTWLQVQPSFEAQQLDADITHIDLTRIDLTHDVQGDVTGRSQVAVTTTNNDIWSSVDGGKTWAKKAGNKK
jgi:Putative zinc-finger